jgi:CHASE3 domain sensor protein
MFISDNRAVTEPGDEGNEFRAVGVLVVFQTGLALGPRGFSSMKNFKIPTKLYLGFGCILILALISSAIGLIGLQNAADTFGTYRKLARQTNADGRVQANMLSTRIFAKNFVIDANSVNIDGVQKRASQTLSLIQETLSLAGTDTGRQILLKDMKKTCSVMSKSLTR